MIFGKSDGAREAPLPMRKIVSHNIIVLVSGIERRMFGFFPLLAWPGVCDVFGMEDGIYAFVFELCSTTFTMFTRTYETYIHIHRESVYAYPHDVQHVMPLSVHIKCMYARIVGVANHIICPQCSRCRYVVNMDRKVTDLNDNASAVVLPQQIASRKSIRRLIFVSDGQFIVCCMIYT